MGFKGAGEKYSILISQFTSLIHYLKTICKAKKLKEN